MQLSVTQNTADYFIITCICLLYACRTKTKRAR